MRPSERLAGFLAECRVNVRGDLRDDLLTRVLYSTDASLYQIMPHAVLVPRTTEDVLAAMSSAAAYGVPVLPRGAGTSLAGQAVNEALVIDFSRHLDQILEIDVEGRLARVQPGVVLDDLNDRLRWHGLKFGPDPASSNRSTIGGAVANNATGSHSLLYGMTVDHVRGMKVVLSDGSEATLGGQNGANAGHDDRLIRIAREIDRLARQPDHQRILREGTPHYWRRCGGYNLDRFMPGGTGNLAQLICGSEGTLAIMTEITVGLVPVPASTGLALLQFDEVHLALSAVEAILETGATAVELLDPLGLRLCRDVPEYARLLASVVEGSPHCLLVVEYSGESEAAVTSAIERLRKRVAAEKPGVTALLPATSDEAQAAVWQVRKAGLGLLMSMKGDMKPVPFIEDAAVPEDNLLGERGAGFKQFLEILDGGRISVAAMGVGLAQGAYDLAYAYAKEREQFGEPISRFQAIQFRLADMATEIEAGRALVYRAAWLKDQGREFAREAAMAKLYTGELSARVAGAALQIHGGFGYMEEAAISRLYRDQKILEIGEGTNEVQRMVIARHLGL